MGLVWKIIAFMFFINIGFGLITTATDLSGNPLFEPTISYSPSMIRNINATFSGEVGGAPAEDQINFGEKVLDFFNLGWVLKVKDAISDFLFGVPRLMRQLGFFSEDQLKFIEVAILFTYFIGIFAFAVGKRMNAPGVG